jgi:hypothetical protein
MDDQALDITLLKRHELLRLRLDLRAPFFRGHFDEPDKQPQSDR